MILTHPLPKYVAPEPTGDELDDLIAETAAFRAWQAACQLVEAGNEKRMAKVRNMFKGLNPVHNPEAYN